MDDGYIVHMDTQQIGRASVELGAGRLIKDAPIDHSAGIMILCKTGIRWRCSTAMMPQRWSRRSKAT